MKTIRILFFLLGSGLSVFAQETMVMPQAVSSGFGPDSINKPLLKKIKLGIGLTYTGVMAAFGYAWYNRDEVSSSPFYFSEDHNEYLQMDKYSHAYATYHISNFTYSGLRKAGVPEKKAIVYSTLTSFLLWTPIEVVDGFIDAYGFSTGDVIANASGSALFGLQQAVFKEQIVQMKISFFPTDFKKYSDKAQRRGGRLSVGGHIFDYNAQTYWFSGNLHKVFYKAPSWLCLSVGIGAKGLVEKYSNPLVNYKGEPLPQFDRYRQILLSLDIDLTKIKTRRQGLKKVFGALNMLKIPAPTLEWNRIDGLKFHPIYF